MPKLNVKKAKKKPKVVARATEAQRMENRLPAYVGREANAGLGVPGPTGGKHNEVTAQSLKRRAHQHHLRGLEHRRMATAVAGGDPVALALNAKHEAISVMHMETCEILNHEAEEIRNQPHRG